MKKSLLLLPLLFTFFLINAQSYSGGEIQIENLGDSIFKTTAYYVKNCFYCSGDKTCDVPDNLTITYGTNSELDVALKIVDSKTSPISKCADCNRCTDDSCAYPYGYTTFKLEGIFSLVTPIKNGNCSFTAVLDVGPLDTSIAAITPSGNSITLTNTFNACVMNATPKADFFGEFTCLGRDVIKSLASNTVDKNQIGKVIDEVVYSLVHLKHGDNDVSYTSPYSYSAPIYYLGFPKENLKFPRGFNLDSTKGDLLFRPMKKENAIIRIKMEEYRDKKLLSTSYKDVYYQVIACPSNDAPNISGINCTSPQPENFKSSVVVGQTICFTVCTSDKDKADTTTLEWNKGIPGATFEILDSSAKNQSARFCWTPTEADISKFPHIFVASTKDNGCPTGAFSARSFSITVKDKPRFEITAEVDNCGKGRIIAQDTGRISVSQWLLGSEGRVQVRNGSLSDTFYLSGLTSGYHKYSLTAMGVNGGSNTVIDSFLSNGMPPFNRGNVRFDICPKDTVFFKTTNYMQKGATIKWAGNNATYSDTLFSSLSDEKHRVIGTLGQCTDTLEIDVNVLNFNEKLVSKNSSGDAPHRVMFSLVDINDANEMKVDFGDGTIKTFNFVSDTFTFFHTYSNKGLYDIEYSLSRKGVNCGKPSVTLNDFANIFPTGVTNQPVYKLDIYPNPNSGHFIVKTDKKIVNIKALSIEGKQVNVNLIGSNEYAITSAPKGLYILEVVFINNEITKKILVIE